MDQSVEKIYVSKNKLDAMADNFIEVHKLDAQPTLDEMIVLAGNSGIGTVTKDATATSNDILEGKTAYVADGKTTGTIETYDGANEGGEVGEAEVITPLFAPTITASDKTVTVTDVRNGDFVQSYNYLLNGNYILEFSNEKTLDVSPYLTGDKDSYKFTTTASGLLLDSPESNDVNYYKVLFKNQDDTLLHTQIQLENVKFKYQGFEPTSDLGNFYGWNENKDGTVRELEFVVNEPKVYYALYTKEFADSLVKVALLTEDENVGTEFTKSVVINEKAYVYLNKKFYCFNPSDNSVTLLDVNGFDLTTFTMTAVGEKIYCFEILTDRVTTGNVAIVDINALTVENITITYPTAIRPVEAVSKDGIIYLIYSYYTSTTYYSMLTIDTSTNTASSISITIYNTNLRAVLVDNSIFIFGTRAGTDSGNTVRLNIYDIETASLSSEYHYSNFNAKPFGRFVSGAIAAIGSDFYALGGGAKGTYNVIYKLSYTGTQLNGFEMQSTMIDNTSQPSAVTIEDKIYVFTGNTVLKYY